MGFRQGQDTGYRLGFRRGDVRFQRGLGSAKKLLIAVAKWSGGGDSDEEPGWDLGESALGVTMSCVMGVWDAWTNHGITPRPGGWLAQPLELLVKIEAISLVVETKRYMAQKESDWSKLTPTQTAVIRWLEGEE